ncbi:MAG: hypothetical protein ACRCTZ_20510, partial [Sarcina sp.]
ISTDTPELSIDADTLEVRFNNDGFIVIGGKVVQSRYYELFKVIKGKTPSIKSVIKSRDVISYNSKNKFKVCINSIDFYVDSNGEILEESGLDGVKNKILANTNINGSIDETISVDIDKLNNII